MTPQELKNSILQLAIQGKLVEQRPEEGTAEELYEQIQAEKQRLITAGKIKKEKLLPEITEDEIPFEIPESWKWVYVSDLFNVRSAMRIHQTDWRTEGIPFFRGRELVELVKTGHVTPEIYIARELYEKNKAKGGIPQKDDILISAVGTIGKTYIVQGTKEFYYKDAYILCMENIGKIFPDYIKLFLDSAYSQNEIKRDAMATTVAQLTIVKAKQLLLALPPLTEQKRIVAKIEELLPYIDRYAKAWGKLEEFNKRFPEDMQKSIFQMAIQGKLVEQRPEEGTAEELYEQIQAEKQKLIKAGKIKKEKPLPEITEDDIPFDIPESWKWVNFSDIATFENGDRSSKYPVESDYVDTGIPFFGAKDMGVEYMSFENVRYISEEKFNELGNGKLMDKDFICLLRGSVGKSAIFKADDKHKTGFICAQMIIIRSLLVGLCDYISCYLSSPYYAKSIEEKVTGTAVRQLPGKELGEMLIPLPPLAEQKRIVARLKEILPLCEGLK